MAGYLQEWKGGDCTIFKQRLQSEIAFLHATDILFGGKNGRAEYGFIWPQYLQRGRLNKVSTAF